MEFVVRKIYLPNQTNHGASTDIPDEEMAKIHTQVVADGDRSEWHKFHWHSHVDMGVFHSSTDTDNYNDMQTGDFAVSLVVNKKYDMLASVHLYKPLRINVLNIDVEPPDIDFKEYQVPHALEKKLQANINRVKKYEEEHQPKVTYYQPAYQQRDWYAQDYNDFGMGLAYDPDFIALLKAGEEQNLIMLCYDDQKNIIGYVNMRTLEGYELNSYIDHTLTGDIHDQY